MMGWHIRRAACAIAGIAMVLGGCISRDPSAPRSLSATPIASSASPDATVAAVLDSFGLKSFSTFEQAEVVAGYHIPRATADFPMRRHETTLRTGRTNARPSSETLYVYPAAPDLALSVDVGPSYYWSDGAFTNGSPTTIGRWSGWLTTDSRYSFAFRCGEVDNVELWCIAWAAPELSRDVFERFVAGLS